VDRVVDEPDVTYRVWYEGTPVGELVGDAAALRAWLVDRHVDVNQLALLAEAEDPFCE
jgi:hypothetical protein